MKIVKSFGIAVVLLIIAVVVALSVVAATQDLTYDSFNNATNISYDNLNRILVKTFSSGQHNYTYDVDYFGTLANVTFANGSVAYEYDDQLRVVKEVRFVDGIRFEKRLYYDSADRVVKQGLEPGNDSVYVYGAQGLVDRVIGFVNSTRYNAFGSVLNRTYGNAKVSNFTYDSRNARLARINAGSDQNLIYGYDSIGNIVVINDSANSRLLTMGYDYLDRLLNTSVNGGQSFAYGYDAVGNLLGIVRGASSSTLLFYGDGPVHAPSRIITGNANVDISSLAMLNNTNKSRVLEFFLANELNATVDAVNWSAEFGDGSRVNSTIGFSLGENESVFVLVEHNYSVGGDYSVNVTAGATGSPSDFERVNAKFGIGIANLGVVSRDITNVSYALVVVNDLADGNNVNWNCNSGESGSVSVNGLSSATVSSAHNYGNAGVVSLNCSVSSGNGNDSASVLVDVKGIEITDYNRTLVDGNTTNIKFNVTNHYYHRSVDWRIVTDGQAFTGTTALIGTSSSVVVSQEINHTTAGGKSAVINVSADDDLQDSFSDRFVLKSVEVEDYYGHNSSPTEWVFDFQIRNYWPASLSASWNVTEPLVTSSLDIGGGESANVSVKANYTTQEVKRPAVNAHHGGVVSTVLERLVAKFVEVMNYQTVVEGRDGSVTEAFVRSNNDSRNVSWAFNTGAQIVAGSQPASLGKGEDIVLIIEHNYSSSGVYNSSLFINSSSFNETREGVVVT